MKWYNGQNRVSPEYLKKHFHRKFHIWVYLAHEIPLRFPFYRAAFFQDPHFHTPQIKIITIDHKTYLIIKAERSFWSTRHFSLNKAGFTEKNVLGQSDRATSTPYDPVANQVAATNSKLGLTWVSRDGGRLPAPDWPLLIHWSPKFPLSWLSAPDWPSKCLLIKWGIGQWWLAE